MPIGFATENHETLLDVEHIIGHLRSKHPNVTYVQMPCANDHGDFVRLAADWADAQIDRSAFRSTLSGESPVGHQSSPGESQLQS